MFCAVDDANCSDILGELLVLTPPPELDDDTLEAPVVPPVACIEFPDVVPLTLDLAVLRVEETTSVSYTHLTLPTKA